MGLLFFALFGISGRSGRSTRSPALRIAQTE